MNLKENMKWATREIELFNKDTDPTLRDNMYKYSDAALQAYGKITNICEDIDKPGVMKSLLIQLLNDCALTPIEDTEEVWVLVENDDNGKYSIYQCKRRSSLFKKITHSGDKDEIEYSDADRYVCIDINNGTNYTGGIGSKILDEIYPITMPYSPFGKIKIFTESFKYHKESISDDTEGVLYFKMDTGSMIKINRFFKKDSSNGKYIEIEESEYKARKKSI